MRYDAVVIGSGPNGLAAAIVLARRGLSVLVLEAKETIGGGARSAEITLPGFRHDLCSAIHPMALVSPLMVELPLASYGLAWTHAPAALAHPLDDGSVALLQRSVDATAEGLAADAEAYRRLMQPLVSRSADVFDGILAPLIWPLPRHPVALGRFGMLALQPALRVAKRFRTPGGRALFAGIAAHSFLPFDRAGSSSIGLALLLAAHTTGWPVARGGAAAITDAMAAHARTLGVVIETGRLIRSLREVPDSHAVLFDVTPRQLASIAEEALPTRYLRQLRRYRYGPGVFKIDWALDGPIPWKAPECLRSATVHAGGTLEEIAQYEHEVFHGRMTDAPFVLCAQQSLFDPTRAPEGKQTGWAYCHVPHGSTLDATELIERQIERFAPGFRDRVLARHTMNTAQLEEHNPNLVGGDIAGGANTLLQFVTRPFPRIDPWSTPNPRLFLASSSTPPGGGVHGMCGYWAAQSALRRRFRR